MRIRATLKALAVRLEGGESPAEIKDALAKLADLPLEIEIAGTVGLEVLETLVELGKERGIEVRSARKEKLIPYTEVVNENLRSGRRIESPGTIVILGDVNAGAEVIAVGDVIVVGKLRGLAHAGANGQEEAAVWATSLEAKQIRIAGHIAQGSGENLEHGPERAKVVDGRIILEAWGKK